MTEFGLFKLVNVDFTTRNGYVWPYPGGTATEVDTATEHDDPCPKFPGDGLCVAKTFNGACSGRARIAHSIGLKVAVDADDILAEDDNKVRAKTVKVLEIFDPETLVRNGGIKNLYGANLAGANLVGADLVGANLNGANLVGANLRYADLRYADLRGANLNGANLIGANLAGADLYGANLAGANLAGANLYRAHLRYANLYGANLNGANLRRADLIGANLDGAIGYKR